MLHDADDGRYVVLHVRNLDITDRTARAELLELRFLGQLRESVDMLGYMNVITVGNIILIGHSRDFAKAALEAFCKFVGSTLQRSPVYGVIDILGFLPLRTGVIESLHDAETEFLAFLAGM